MDIKNKGLISVFLILYIKHVSGAVIPQPEVHILDGKVTVVWEHPKNASLGAVYTVQMAKYNGREWADVSGCTGITRKHCLITTQIRDFKNAYKVKIKLIKGNQTSESKAKRFLINESDLEPPTFTLLATSSTLKVNVHEKPILRKIFAFGVLYTIYLEEADKENKTNKVYIRDDDERTDEMTTLFTGLRWGRKYCVSAKVESISAPSSSDVSKKQCLFLPEQEFYIIAASSLSILGILGVVAITTSVLLCYLKRPAKTPIVLKSPPSGWQPLSVTEGSMEVVTDRGWFLSSYQVDRKTTVNLPETNVTIIKDCEEENRRTSLDSGLSVEADSAASKEEKPAARQEDSGCGSMGGPESSADSNTDYPLQDLHMEADDIRKREDSGMGMSCQLHSSSLNFDGHDSLVQAVIVGNYRTQSPAEMQIQSRDNENMLKQIPAHSILAEVVTGYKAGPQSCICSETGQCSWCHRYGNYKLEGTKQYPTICMKSLLLGGTSDLVDSTRINKTHLDSVITNLEESFSHVTETFPLLTLKYEQDSNMNNIPLSLCDVQLTTD